MPYVGKPFSDSDVGEIGTYSFDFSLVLNAGESISITTWTCTDKNNVDTDPAARRLGSCVVTGTIVSQRISGMVAGANYLMVATITTDQGNVKSLWSFARAYPIG